jgi:hypothetical protein
MPAPLVGRLRVAAFSKYQVVIPRAARKALGLKAGDELLACPGHYSWDSPNSGNGATAR